MKKIISYMERKIPFYFTAMLVPMLLFGAICVFIEITPFGDHSFLIADMEKQYLDFFSYYQSIFQGKHNFLYTFNRALVHSHLQTSGWRYVGLVCLLSQQSVEFASAVLPKRISSGRNHITYHPSYWALWTYHEYLSA